MVDGAPNASLLLSPNVDLGFIVTPAGGCGARRIRTEEFGRSFCPICASPCIGSLQEAVAQYVQPRKHDIAKVAANCYIRHKADASISLTEHTLPSAV